MKQKVRLIMMSHLSDAQDGIYLGATIHSLSEFSCKHKINFVKFLLLKYPNTDTEVDARVEYEAFKKKHPTL